MDPSTEPSRKLLGKIQVLRAVGMMSRFHTIVYQSEVSRRDIPVI